MKLFKLIGWGQPAVGCFIGWRDGGRGGLYLCSMVGEQFSCWGRRLFARVLTWSRELPITVSVAAGGLGGGRSCVRLSACISMGFSWAQFSGVMAEVLTLKSVLKKTSGSGCPYEIVALFHSQCCSSWTWPGVWVTVPLDPSLWASGQDGRCFYARCQLLTVESDLSHPCARALACSGMEKWRSVSVREKLGGMRGCQAPSFPLNSLCWPYSPETFCSARMLSC